MTKKLIRLTEGDLNRIVKESVNKILNEGMISPGKWKYQGDEADKYMWALKKDAEKKGEIRKDGWPSAAYLSRFINYASNLFDAGFDNAYIFNDDYSMEDLYSLADDYLYRKALEFGKDVLGRPSQKIYRSWFKNS